MPPVAPPRKILLIGWDAADWQVIDPLLEAGILPNLKRLIEDGAWGNLATLHPPISPMLWNSIATGKTAEKHGIHGFTECAPDGKPRPVSSTSRKTKALWNIFQQALGWRCHVVGWWASHPAEPLDGIVVSDWFTQTKLLENGTWRVPPHAVHPMEWSEEMGPYRMAPDEVTDDMVLPFIPKAAEVDQRKDRRLESFARVFADCCTIQAAVTAAMEGAEWDFTAVYFDGIDHFSHGFMPYHPPRQEHVPEQDYEIYKEVITGVYRFHDLMLGRQLELAGPEAVVVVCSDHGFKSGITRPFGNPNDPAGPILWHREYGILVMHGPGIKKNERITGATLLDIAPTLLTLCGLPMGKDMDGKPLLQVFENLPRIQTIPSWDAVEGKDGRHPPDFQWTSDPRGSEELMRQFAALGYINDPAADRENAGASIWLENHFNLAQVHLSAGRFEEAVRILEGVVSKRNWETRFIHQLANAYLRSGRCRAADELLENAYSGGPDEPDPPMVAWMLRARAKVGLRDLPGAAQYLRQTMRRILRHAPAWVEAGNLWLDLPDQTEAAESCFRRALELDPDSAQAWMGLSTVHLRQRRNGEAVDAALEAVRLLHHLPQAHMNLGIALAREKQFEDAVVAFRRVVGMLPQALNAHRWLAALHAVKEPDSFLAGVHRNEVQRHSALRSADVRMRAELARQSSPVGPLPCYSERLDREHRTRPDPAPAREPSGRIFTLVSGLPRSGTSLMMQMLEAAGLRPQTDGLRTADEDNPEGYYEWEAIKQIAKAPELLDAPELENRAIKIVSALLPYLPSHHRYRVIFMLRPCEEIAQSQAKMIARRGEAGMEGNLTEIANTLQGHRNATLSLLRNLALFEVLEVDFPSLVAEPEAWIPRIVEFVGADLLPDAEKMVQAVRRDLHRNRAATV